MITIKATKNTYTVFYGENGDWSEAIVNPEDLEAYFDCNDIQVYDDERNPILTKEQLNEIEHKIAEEATEDYYNEVFAWMREENKITEEEAEQIKEDLEIFISQRIPNFECQK